MCACQTIVLLRTLQDPVSRNRYYGGYPGHPQTFYDAMSLNSNALPYAAGICGGQVRQAARAHLMGADRARRPCSRVRLVTRYSQTAHDLPIQRLGGCTPRMAFNNR